MLLLLLLFMMTMMLLLLMVTNDVDELMIDAAGGKEGKQWLRLAAHHMQHDQVLCLGVIGNLGQGDGKLLGLLGLLGWLGSLGSLQQAAVQACCTLRFALRSNTRRTNIPPACHCLAPCAGRLADGGAKYDLETPGHARALRACGYKLQIVCHVLHEHSMNGSHP